jgi:AhpD family alkylhydroperoxidase
MSQRLQLEKVIPEGFRAVFGLERYVRGRLDGELLELIKLRASMINGCAFCVDMHTTEALDAGEDIRRLVALSAWRESPFFTEPERIALELTDAVTRLDDHGVPDALWDEAVKELGDETTADLVVAIATINVWNRLAVTNHTSPPPLSS